MEQIKNSWPELSEMVTVEITKQMNVALGRKKIRNTFTDTEKMTIMNDTFNESRVTIDK